MSDLRPPRRDVKGIQGSGTRNEQKLEKNCSGGQVESLTYSLGDYVTPENGAKNDALLLRRPVILAGALQGYGRPLVPGGNGRGEASIRGKQGAR